MVKNLRTQLSYNRAIVSFIWAYVVVTLLAFGLFCLIALFLHIPVTADFNIRENAAYITADRLYPLLNLVVWTFFSGVYFRKLTNHRNARQASIALGTLWLVLALIIDLVGFVLIKHPFSLSASDFYIGQAPWIYLTYVAVFVSPSLYSVLPAGRGRGTPAKVI